MEDSKLKGFYLNDVPVNIFLDYFDKTTYGEEVKNTPVMECNYDIWNVPRVKIIKTETTNEVTGKNLTKFKTSMKEIKDSLVGTKIGRFSLIKKTIEFNINDDNYPCIKLINKEFENENSEFLYYSGYKNIFFTKQPLKNTDVKNNEPEKCYKHYIESKTFFEYDGEILELQSYSYNYSNDTGTLTLYCFGNSNETGENSDIFLTPGLINKDNEDNFSVNRGRYYKSVTIDGTDEIRNQLLTCYTISGYININGEYVIDFINEHYDEYDKPFIFDNGQDIITSINYSTDASFSNGENVFIIEDLNSNIESLNNKKNSLIAGTSVYGDFIYKFMEYDTALRKKLHEKLNDKEIDNKTEYEDLRNILNTYYEKFINSEKILNKLSFSINQFGDYKKYFYLEEKNTPEDIENTSTFKLYIIMEGLPYSVPKVNDKGENLYRDSFGLLTTSEVYKNNFYTHQDVIRKTFFGITKNSGWMYRAQPRHVVLLSGKEKDIFSYYDEYIKTTTYKEISTLPGSGDHIEINVSNKVIPKNYLDPGYKKRESIKFKTDIKDLNNFPQYTIYSDNVEANKLRTPTTFYYGDTEDRYKYNYYAFRLNRNNSIYLGDYDQNNIPEEIDIGVTIDGQIDGRFKTIKGFYNNLEYLKLQKGFEMAVQEKQYMNIDNKDTIENEQEKTAVIVDRIYKYIEPGFYAQDTTFIDSDNDILKGEKKYDFSKKIPLSYKTKIKYNDNEYIFIDTADNLKNYIVSILDLNDNSDEEKQELRNTIGNYFEEPCFVKTSISSISDMNEESAFIFLNDMFNGEIVFYNRKEYTYFAREGFYDKIPCREIYKKDIPEEVDIPVEITGSKIEYLPLHDDTYIRFNNINYKWENTSEYFYKVNESNEKLSISVEYAEKWKDITGDLNIKEGIFDAKNIEVDSVSVPNISGTRVKADNGNIYQYDMNNNFININDSSDILSPKKVKLFNKEYYWDENKLIYSDNNNETFTPKTGCKVKLSNGSTYYYHDKFFVSEDGKSVLNGDEDIVSYINSYGIEKEESWVWDPKKSVLNLSEKYNTIHPSAPQIKYFNKLYDLSEVIDNKLVFTRNGGKELLNIPLSFNSLSGYYYNAKNGVMHNDLQLKGPTSITHNGATYYIAEDANSNKYFYTILPLDATVDYNGIRYYFKINPDGEPILKEKWYWWWREQDDIIVKLNNQTDPITVKYDDKLYTYNTSLEKFISILGENVVYIDEDVVENLSIFSRLKSGIWIGGANIIDLNSRKNVTIKKGARMFFKGELYIYDGADFRKIILDDSWITHKSSKYGKDFYLYLTSQPIGVDDNDQTITADVLYKAFNLFSWDSNFTAESKENEIFTYKKEKYICKEIEFEFSDKDNFKRYFLMSEKPLRIKVKYKNDSDYYWNGEKLLKSNNPNSASSFVPSSGTLILYNKDGDAILPNEEIKNNTNYKPYRWDGSNFREVGVDGLLYNILDMNNKAVYHLNNDKLNDYIEGPFDLSGTKNRKLPFIKTPFNFDCFERQYIDVLYEDKTLKWDGENLYQYNSGTYIKENFELISVKTLDESKEYIWNINAFVNKDNSKDTLSKNTKVLYNEEFIYTWNGSDLTFIPISPVSSTEIIFDNIRYYYYEGNNSFRRLLSENLQKFEEPNKYFKRVYFYHFKGYQLFETNEYSEEKTEEIYWNGIKLINKENNTITIEPKCSTSFRYNDRYYVYYYNDKCFKYGEEVFSFKVDKMTDTLALDSTGWTWDGNELIGRAIPLPYKFKPGDSFVNDGITYRYHVGFCYNNKKIYSPKISEKIFYNGQEYSVSFNKDRGVIYFKDKKNNILYPYENMEIHIENNGKKQFYTYLAPIGSNSTEDMKFYEKEISEGSLVYSPEIASRAGLLEIPFSITEKPKPELAILNVYDRTVNIKGITTDKIVLNNNDSVSAKVNISTSKQINTTIDKDNLTTSFESTIFNFKGDNPFMLFPMFKNNNDERIEDNNELLRNSVGKYFSLEIIGSDGPKLYNGKFKSKNAYNTLSIYVDFEDGKFEGEVLSSEDLGLSEEDLSSLPNNSLYFVKINLEPIEIKQCRKILCEISPAEAAAKIQTAEVKEYSHRPSPSLLSASINKVVSIIPGFIGAIIGSITNSTSSKNEKNISNDTFAPKFNTIPESTINTAPMAIPQFYKDKYRISDCLYLDNFVDDKIGNFFEKMEEHMKDENALPENAFCLDIDFLSYVQNLTGDGELEQEKIKETIKSKITGEDEVIDKFTAKFISKEYFENYYSIDKPYIEKVVTYTFNQPGKLDQFPSTEKYPEFNIIEISGIQTSRYTIQQHYKESGRYYVDEISKARGDYISETVVANERKSALKDTLKRILQNKESEEISIKQESKESNALTNIYNYCKGVNFLVANDLDFKNRTIAKERPLNKIDNENYKVLLENKYYIGMIGDDIASLNMNQFSNTSSSGDNTFASTFEGDDKKSAITLDVKEIKKILKDNVVTDERPLLERLANYNKYPLTKMYENYLRGKSQVNLTNAVVDNNVNKIKTNKNLPTQPHLQKYLNESLASVIDGYINGIIEYVKNETAELKNNISIGSDYYTIYFENKIESLTNIKNLKIQPSNTITDKAIFNISSDEIELLIDRLVRIKDYTIYSEEETTDNLSGPNYMKWEVFDGGY